MTNLHHYSLDDSNPFLSTYYIGPSIEQGPLPALFYFALSAKDSLLLDPFNQPIQALSPLAHAGLIRIFSVTIPGHEGNLPKELAIKHWVDLILQGIDPISPFIRNLTLLIDDLLEKNVLVKDLIVCSGLSRGGYIATMLAAHHKLCNKVVGFAPLTRLKSTEFDHLQSHPIVALLDLFNHLDSLSHTRIRYYIGNRDTRVGTQNAVDLITSLATIAHEKRIKGSSFELIMSDSIGYMGHGTSEEVFLQGVSWIKHLLHLLK